jgi:site-specific recombinase XerD
VEAFLAARRAAGYVQWCSVKALVPLLGYLRGLGVVAEPVAQPPTPVESLLGRYRSYLLGERGLAATTARGYVDMVRPFVAGRVTAGGGLDLAGLVPGDVTRFVLGACVGRNRGSAKVMVTALRSLLGFLHVDGVTAGSLVSAVPSVASWRLAGLPRGLPAGQVRRLLASCDRRSIIGRRDVAILTLLVRLGLRAGEAARLGLDDIDWAAGEITVDGKGPRRERLPVPVDVGEAVVGYLRRGRPHDAEARTLFVTVRAPHRPLTPGGVSAIVDRAGRRAGLGALGSHRLRHTVATELVRAGAPLAEIGQLLRHRQPLTTAIYANVDRDALRTLARPWPAGDAS